MKIWAKCIKENKIVSDVVQEFALARPSDIEGWNAVLTDICRELDLGRPIVLNKHLQHWNTFQRADFFPDDFMEEVSFDKFSVEILPEPKKKRRMMEL